MKRNKNYGRGKKWRDFMKWTIHVRTWINNATNTTRYGTLCIKLNSHSCNHQSSKRFLNILQLFFLLISSFLKRKTWFGFVFFVSLFFLFFSSLSFLFSLKLQICMLLEDHEAFPLDLPEETEVFSPLIPHVSLVPENSNRKWERFLRVQTLYITSDKKGLHISLVN